ncbi:MAG: hypothetical protein IJW00_05865 [Clostridia bacterium]|nr:hypothetical protein [Clostridia bacterium]
MEKLSKNNRIANRVISMIIGILVGVVLVVIGSVIKAETLVWLALVIWGVIIIIGNVPGLIYSIANIKSKGAVFDLIISVIGVLLGVGLIISQNQVITVILAAYMIVFPVIRIVLAKANWAEQLKRELLRIILGVVLLIFGGTLLGVGYTILNLILKVIGWVVIGITVVLGIVEIILIATKKEEKSDEPIYVEHNEN